MKTTALFLLASLLLASCGEDAASKKLAADTEARVTASIQQLLVNAGDKVVATSYIKVVHTWYQSDVPNLVKLSPKAETIYETHAAILQEVATNEPKLTKAPILTPEQAEGIKSKYKQLVDESADRVQELSILAMKKTTMSEAEQLKYVSELADKQTHHLGLVQYYTKRTDAAITQREQKLKHSKYMRETWGLE